MLWICSSNFKSKTNIATDIDKDETVFAETRMQLSVGNLDHDLDNATEDINPIGDLNKALNCLGLGLYSTSF